MRSRVTLLAATGLMLAVAACGETTVNAPLAAGTVAAISGNDQGGVVRQALANPIVVCVPGSDDQPLPGAQVAFAVTTGGGTVTPAAATTDNNGIASVRWTLGPTAGANVLTVTAGSASTTVAASASADRAAVVNGTAGDNQSVVVDTPVIVSPRVRVSAANGNPVQGVAVTLAVASGGGRVTDGLRRTDAAGVAAVGSWILGAVAGVQQVSAAIAGVNPGVFSATASAGAASQLLIVAGNNQRARTTRAVPIAPSVVVRDALGNRVAGAVVTFAVTS